MNKQLKQLYTATYGNEVVLFETNLEAFITKLRYIIPGLKSDNYYRRYFKREKTKTIKGPYGGLYTIQKVL